MGEVSQHFSLQLFSVHTSLLFYRPSHFFPLNSCSFSTPSSKYSKYCSLSSSNVSNRVSLALNTPYLHFPPVCWCPSTTTGLWNAEDLLRIFGVDNFGQRAFG